MNFISKLRYRLTHCKAPAICYDIAGYARQNGWQCSEIHHALSDMKSLVIGDKRAEREFNNERQHFIKPQSLVVVPRARVRDKNGLLFLPNGEVCFECNWWLPALKKLSGYSACRRKKRELKGDVFSLLGMWSDTYFHWFHDTLPRLWNSLPHLPESTLFLIHDNPPSYQLESLEAVGISRQRLVTQPDVGESIIENLWFATPLGTATFGGGDTISALGKAISEKMIGGDTIDKSRLYISRSGARFRRIVNEHELIPILEKHGFTILNMEDLSFREQVRMCSSASHMIGMHGAGLTNAIFCQEGAVIGEISNGLPVPCYSVLARQLGHDFHRLSLEQKGSDENIDIAIDVDIFSDWIDRMFAC